MQANARTAVRDSFFPVARTCLLTFMLLAGALPLAATADFEGLVVERITHDDFGRDLVRELGMPANLSVWRISARFSDPTDRLVGGVASPDNPLDVHTLDGSGFYNAPQEPCGNYCSGGLCRPPQSADALVLAELNYDTWLTIGNTLRDVTPSWPSGAGSKDGVIIDPGFPCMDDPWESNVNAWVTSPEGTDPESGEIEPTPQTVAGNYPENTIPLLQITIDSSTSLHGTMGLLVFDPEPAEIGVEFTAPPPCVGDTNGDSIVDVQDLVNVTLAWGTDDAAADIDGSGTVDVVDLISVITAWGPCD